jgi:DNA-binding MarR family transcriptional regulator
MENADDIGTGFEAKPTSGGSGDRSADFATRTVLDKWFLMKAINEDRDLTAAAKVIAFSILEQYNDGHGYAWPGFGKLAKMSGLSEKTVERAVQSLESRGWFRVDRSNATKTSRRSADRTNRYFPNWSRAGSTGRKIKTVRLSNLADKPTGTGTVKKTDKTNYSKHDGETPASNVSGSSSVKAKRGSRQTALPVDWGLDRDRREIAMAAGVDPSTISRELKKFVAHHRANGSRKADWNEAWNLWCLNSADRSAPPKRQRSVI